MSKLARKRKAVNYEAAVPRCSTCMHYGRKRIDLRDSMPIRIFHLCNKHQFEVSAVGCCDTWASKDGRKVIDFAPVVRSAHEGMAA